VHAQLKLKKELGWSAENLKKGTEHMYISGDYPFHIYSNFFSLSLLSLMYLIFRFADYLFEPNLGFLVPKVMLYLQGGRGQYLVRSIL